MDLSNSVKEAILAAMAHRILPPSVLGPATSLKCFCGGILHKDVEGLRKRAEETSAALASRTRPRHRKKRILKKRIKAWQTRMRVLNCVTMLVAGCHPTFVCAKCSRREGFYGAIGRNLIQVEPMPSGALPIYDRDLEVAGILGGDP